ncbi:MAG: glycosyltransferase family 2 protein [Rhodoferax sp.]|nr:glycosyltransferase family 2 protein [Rhodoferax sp.]
MNVLLLAAGLNTTSVQDDEPFCLREFNGIPLIQHLANRCLSLHPASVIVAMMEDDIRKYHLDNVVALVMPQAHLFKIHAKTQGAACTALLCGSRMNGNDELLIVSANEMLDIDFAEVVAAFRKRELDGGAVVFDSVHPRYSYLRLGADNFAVEAAEKRPISRNATASFYWFRNSTLFFEAAKNMIRKDAHVNGSFYICPTFNELILNQLRIGAYPVDAGKYYPLKTDKQLDGFEAAIERTRRNEDRKI